ncbi:hypothetical protein CsSME_00022976 [Camellia sinensis var. sinensis]
MVCSSLSLLYSPCSSFPSNSTNDSPSTSSSPSKLRSFKRNPRVLKLASSTCSSSSQFWRIEVRSKLSVDEDGSAEQFLRSNSITDFMRFKRGNSDAELQTAVVSYKKKFPWSLLRPFLQVDLVPTIHIADKDIG